MEYPGTKLDPSLIAKEANKSYTGFGSTYRVNNEIGNPRLAPNFMYVGAALTSLGAEVPSVPTAYSKLRAPPRNPRAACFKTHLITRASL